MPRNVQMFFSNQLEILYQNLKTSLFSSTFPSHPLLRRIIVVYGPAMKTWLMTRMARDQSLGIAFGLEFIYLNQAFDSLVEITTTQKNHIPSQLELRFAIEQEFMQIIKNFSELTRDEQTSWLSFMEYLKIDQHDLRHQFLSQKVQNRLIGLSEHLASLFQDYGKTAPEMLSDWESSLSNENWQAYLWYRIHKKYSWSYSSKTLKNPIISIENTSISFFSISFITMPEFAFIHELSKKCDLTYYMLSPCAVFWTDIRSDREASYIQSFWTKKLGKASSQVLQLEEILRDRNPLLANFGRLGRQMASQIEYFDLLSYANYAISNSVQIIHKDDFENEDVHVLDTHKPLSLLHAVQADVLLMRNPQQKEVVDVQNDPASIQLHIVSSLRREIEVLYHNLLDLLMKNPSFTPGDIIVMAPDIKGYVPYIRSIFGDGFAKLDFQILDLEMQTQNEIVQGFLQLFDLSESRWEINRILQLFAHSCFQHKHSISSSDYQIIHKWMTKAGILWGSDSMHRNEVLKKNHCKQEMVENSETGTWEQGFHRLLSGLTTILNENTEDSDQDITPCALIDFSQSELLSKCIKLLHALRDDLSPLHDHSQMTIENWTKYLRCLLQNYFSPNSHQLASIEEFAALENQLERLRSATYFLKDARFSFSSIRSNLLSLLKHCSVSYREELLSAIQFCSLLPLRSIPAKIICILGLQEDAFPRRHSPSSLDVRKQKSSDLYSTSSIDFDRYLFLETLHSAQDYLLLSYQGYSAKDGKEVLPSLLVQELFSYCDRNYLLQGKKMSSVSIFRHPFLSFDKMYFSSTSSLKNFSIADWKICSLQEKSQTPSKKFARDFTWNESRMNELKGHIEIPSKYIMLAARNPIKFHMNHVLQMYLQTEEDRKAKSEEHLSLSSLDKFKLTQLAMKKPYEKVMKHAEQEGLLPFGLFKEIAVKGLKEEFENLHSSFSYYSIDASTLSTMEFSSLCISPTQCNKNHWLLPAPKIHLTDTFSVSIVGKIGQVSPYGLITMNKFSLPELWKLWPQFLLFCYGAQQLPDQFKSMLIFLVSKKERKAFFNDPFPYLSLYLHYYFQCLQQFSPLVPEWIPFILENNPEALQKKMFASIDNSFRSYSDPYLKWILDLKQMPDAESIIRDWNPIAKTQLESILQHWIEK